MSTTEMFYVSEMALGKLHDHEVFYDFEEGVREQWLDSGSSECMNLWSINFAVGPSAVHAEFMEGCAISGERRGAGEDQGGVRDFVRDETRGTPGRKRK